MMTLTADAGASRSDRLLQETPRAKSFMKVYGKTPPPIGHVQFCRRYTDECGNGSGVAKQVKLNDIRWDELVKVNDYVNRRIRPATDQELYNTPENWAYPEQYGDCEDYVLLKRRHLTDLGWPVEALLITVARDHDNQGHAVLTVVTETSFWTTRTRISCRGIPPVTPTTSVSPRNTPSSGSPSGGGLRHGQTP